MEAVELPRLEGGEILAPKNFLNFKNGLLKKKNQEIGLNLAPKKLHATCYHIIFDDYLKFLKFSKVILEISVLMFP